MYSVSVYNCPCAMQEYTLSTAHLLAEAGECSNGDERDAGDETTPSRREEERGLFPSQDKYNHSIHPPLFPPPPQPPPLFPSIPPSISPSPPSHQEIEKRLERSRMSKKDRLRKEIMAARELNPSEVSHW